MAYIVGVLLALMQTAPAPGLNALVDGVERTFARMRDLSADFVQTEQNSLNRKDQASGHLYLAKPRKTRWEYQSPEPQLFVSDGKVFFSYVPGDRQVQKGQVGEEFDDRIPLMFLVGRSNLRGEFTRFEEPRVKPGIDGTRTVRMYPRRKTDFVEVLMEVDPKTYFIRRLILKHADGSLRDLVLSNIQINTGLKDSLFDFKPPAGVQVLEGKGQ